MTASVILEDTLLLKESLVQMKSYFFNRTDDYVKIKGPHWKIRKDYKGIYLPREVVRNDGSSGLTYTAYALTTMSQCFGIFSTNLFPGIVPQIKRHIEETAMSWQIPILISAGI